MSDYKNICTVVNSNSNSSTMIYKKCSLHSDLTGVCQWLLWMLVVYFHFIWLWRSISAKIMHKKSSIQVMFEVTSKIIWTTENYLLTLHIHGVPPRPYTRTQFRRTGYYPKFCWGKHFILTVRFSLSCTETIFTIADDFHNRKILISCFQFKFWT